MFNPQDDPLGLGLKARAREHRWADMMANPQSQLMGPLPDEQWDAFFQAVRESGGGKPVSFAGATDASSPVNENAPAGEQFAAHSNQFRGTPVLPQNPALAGLRKLRRG